MLSLIATDLPRFVACNGHLKVDAFKSCIESDDTSRLEGDAVHWLIEQVHKHHQPLDGMVSKQAPNGIFITADMVENVTEYLTDIKGIGQVEFDTSFEDTGKKWRIGGRADHVFQGEGCLRIRDFKWGFGIVEPEMNYTLIWHAIGFLLRAKAMGFNYSAPKLSVFEFFVYQPRPHHPKGKVRKWTVPRGTLEDIWEKVEAMLENPTDICNTGPNCTNCDRQVNCGVFTKALNNALEITGKAFSDTIDNVNLSTQLDLTKRALTIIKQANTAYEELAKHRLKLGQNIPNYAVERSLGNREWKKGTTPEFLQMMTGKDLSKKELITPAQADKLVSKELVASLTVREEKGINLARIDTNARAEKLFNQTK